MTLKQERPPLLILICFAGLLGCCISLFFVLSPPVRNISSWYPAYVFFGIVYSIACLFNLLLMRRWAVWAYGAWVLANQLVCWKLNIWDERALTLSGLILAVSLLYYRRLE